MNCSQLVASHRSLFLRLWRDVGLEEDGYFHAAFGGEPRQRNNHGAVTIWHAQPAITSISAPLESWHRHEAAEPDISTERLMAMVRDDTGAEPDWQVQALRRAGMLRRN